MVIFFATSLSGMHSPGGKGIERPLEGHDIEKLHKLATKSSLNGGASLADSQESRIKLNEFIVYQLQEAEREQKSIVTRAKVKSATLSMAMSGIAIYNAISSLLKTANGETSGEEGYTTQVTQLIGSGFLFWYSGKEVWKIARNHHATRRAEKALLLKYILKEESESSSSVMVIDQTSSSYGEVYDRSTDTV